MTLGLDQHFEVYLAARRASGIGPAVEEQYVAAWQAYRTLPGSDDPQHHRRLHWRLPYAQSRLISGLLSVWQRQGVLPPFRVAHFPPQRPEKSRPFMRDQQVQALLTQIDDLGVRVLAYLVYVTGIQASRLLELRQQDVNLQTSLLSLPGAEVVLELRPEAVEALERWQVHRDPQASHLLHTQSGDPITLAFASQALRTAGSKAGCPATGFGHLQHAYLRIHRTDFWWMDEKELGRWTQQPFRLKYLPDSPQLWESTPPGTPLIFPPKALFPRARKGVKK